MKSRWILAIVFFLIFGCLAMTLASPPADTGTITGKVTYTGTPPKPRPIDMSKEPACSMAHSTPAMSQVVATGPGNSLANVVVYVSAGDQGSTAPSKAVKLDQKGCEYVPHVVVLQVGQVLEISNNDPASHNIQASSKINPSFNKGQPAGSAPVEVKYDKPEFIHVKCNIHPWMSAWLAVVNTSHSAVTDQDGAFRITGLPPGKYTLSAWQEQAGLQTQEVTVGAGETKNVNFVLRVTPY
ncbi:MAG TPA: carboxypeptidase regulatory-like domain-containing protein [Candidatus Aquilonibacter sp.]|nr:carboxypeptidase regulatory-like domain-containing protein [Candidatus Aquilonibacter sp.]